MRHALAILTCVILRAAEPYVVGPNVQVSLAQQNIQHYETQVAADPRRAGHLIACAYVIRTDGKIDNVFYVSFDHGQTWKHTLTVPDSVDPSCAIGLKGEAFAASIHDKHAAGGSTDSFLDVRRSRDGGRTWQESDIRIDTRSVDRNYLTVDDTRGPYRGRVYVHGYLQTPKDSSGKPLQPAFVFYPSTDGGRTFDRVVVRDASEFSKPWFFPANGVVSSDGTFAALYVELDNTKRNMSYRTDPASAPKGVNGVLKVMRSRDGGQTLEEASKIADVYHDWRVPQLSISSLAIDRRSGRMYAVWPDAGVDRRTQVFLSYSSDTGRAWSAPRVVSDDAASVSAKFKPNNFMPMVAVNKNGVVGICWYDRRDNPDNLGFWVRFSASLDGGVTWLPSVRVSTHANVVHPEDHDTRFNAGDTTGLTADADGIFHPLWIDNRTGIHQMWTAAVTVARP